MVNMIKFEVRRRREKTRHLGIIGDGPMTGSLIKHISDDPHWDYNVKVVVRVKKEKSV